MTGIDVVHVPYRGTPALVTALRAQQIDYGVELVHVVMGQVQAGELKLLAVGTSQRWPAIPNVPTVAESGVPGYAVIGWYGWLYPAGTPQAIVDKTNTALRRWRGRRFATSRQGRGGCERVVVSSDFGKYIADEVAMRKTGARRKPGLNRNKRHDIVLGVVEGVKWPTSSMFS